MATQSTFISMSAAARLLGIPVPTFRKNFMTGFYPFLWFRISPYRMGFRRADIENYAASIEPVPLVSLKDGEKVEAVRTER